MLSLKDFKKFNSKQFSDVSKIFGGVDYVVDTPIITSNRTGDDNSRGDGSEKDEITTSMVAAPYKLEYA